VIHRLRLQGATTIDLTSSQALELAAALIEMADEFDHLQANDPAGAR
jgi:hypothetical protein